MAHAKDGVVTSSFEYALNQDGKRAQLREQLTHPASSSVASVARTIDYDFGANALAAMSCFKREHERLIKVDALNRRCIRSLIDFRSDGKSAFARPV